MNQNKKPFLVEHLTGRAGGRFPVWMMRQAGRFLPAYRAIREKYSFWEMVTDPAVATEVTLLPINEFELDAAIIFSDILSLPYGMGMPIEMRESVGPVIVKPLRRPEDFRIFRDFYPGKHTKFVTDTVSAVRKKMDPSKAVIGFAGAPWTVACYLIEGQGKTGFNKPREWMREDPVTLSESLRDLGSATLSYLKAQVDAGADVIQLFDTWLGEMSPVFFAQHYLPMLNEIFSSLRAVQEVNVPIVYFAKGVGSFVHSFDKLSATVLGVETGFDINEFDRITGGNFSLQGNFDPQMLLTADEATVRRETRLLVGKARQLSRPPIMNLGHGVFPKTPVENVRAFVEEARTLWT